MRRLIFLLVCLCPGLDSAWAAPPQLLGKSITATWDVTRVRRNLQNGDVKEISHHDVLNIYISGRGRIFNQMIDRRTDRHARDRNVHVKERVTASGTALEDKKRQWRFEGNTLAGHKMFDRGAQRIAIAFDDAFTRCSTSVTFGKPEGAGAIIQTSRSRKQFEILSIRVSSTSCTIKQSNIFAEQ
jgi:hypothetical protein